MVMVSKFSNFPDELTENDELREFELSGSDCSTVRYAALEMKKENYSIEFLYLHFLDLGYDSIQPV